MQYMIFIIIFKEIIIILYISYLSYIIMLLHSSTFLYTIPIQLIHSYPYLSNHLFAISYLLITIYYKH